MFSKKIKIVLSGLLLIALCIQNSYAEEPLHYPALQVSALKAPGSFRGPGPNLKVLPALYWNTVGLEFEMSSGLISYGIVGMYKFNERYGSDKNFKVRPEDYQKDGFRAEIFARYYYRGEAPVGIFVEGKAFYNTIIYFDGNPMPYTLYNRWKELDGLRAPTEKKKPSPLGIGIATGLQVMVVPNAIIANLKVGMDLNQDNADNGKKLFLTLYLQPSIGISF